MPELVHVFQRGRMNKDLDERLVPNGEYRDALNIDIANSENGNIGTLQNLKGTIQLRNTTEGSWTANYIDSLTNPVCIGTYRNDKTECIYWFIASDEASCIAEFNQTTGVISPVLVELKATSDTLKFSNSYLITAINIIDNFLFWTDDQTEPKKINIEKFKVGSVNFATHTKIPAWDPVSETYNVDLTGRPNFTEADTTVIKKSPLTAPTINALSSKFGNDQIGTGTNFVSFTEPVESGFDMSDFTYQPNTAIPEEYESLPTYAEWQTTTKNGTDTSPYTNSSLSNSFKNRGITRISFTGGPGLDKAWKKGSVISIIGEKATPYDSDYEYQLQAEIDYINSSSPWTVDIKIQSISTNITRFEDSSGNRDYIQWKALLVEEGSLFEYKFPRFAYRWKYIDNEYSTFSPFSEIAFLGSKWKYSAKEGYNTGMINIIKELTIEGLDWSNDEISEIDILYKESIGNVVYKIETLKKSDYVGQSIPTTFEIKNELTNSAIEANQLLRPWDNVPRKAKAQEFIGNRIVYGNYLQNYNLIGTINTSGQVSNSVDLSLNINSSIVQDVDILFPAKSVKSIRTYQAGVVFKDEYGRETPVFTSKEASYKIPISRSNYINKLAITPNNVPPAWATHYKFFVKETSADYYNLPLDRYYIAEDGNVWLSFPSSERSKVDEDTYLILKKEHNTANPIDSLNRFKVLSISNQAPAFITKENRFILSRTVTASSDIESGNTTIFFEGPNGKDDTSFSNNFTSDNKIVISFGGTISNFYEIASTNITGVDLDNYSVTVKGVFGPDTPTISSAQDFDFLIYKEEQVQKPEFEGRFFVKIERNSTIDSAIIQPSLNIDVTYLTIYKENFRDYRNPASDPLIVQDIIPFIDDWGKYPNSDQSSEGMIVYADPGTEQRREGWRLGTWAEKGFMLNWGLMANGWGYIPDGIGEFGPITTSFAPYEPQLDEYYSVGDAQDYKSPYWAWKGNESLGIPGYAPPAHGQNYFGVTALSKDGIRTGGYFDKLFGNAAPIKEGENGEGFWNDTPNGYLSAGTQIRFINQDPNATTENKVSQVYKITKAAGISSKRGGLNSSRKIANAGWNERYSIICILDKPISETWMPGGGASENDSKWQDLIKVKPEISIVEPFVTEDNVELASDNPAIFETEPKESVEFDIYYEASDALPIANYNDENQELSWFNCFTYGNGVESDRIRDDFGAPAIGNGVKVSTVLDEPYAEERRGSGFIFSQIYNSTSGINRLNQFIQAENITKDINPTYGSVQKMHARNTNLIALCEDKILNILANKDALYNADGNVNVTSNFNVLGQAAPYAGEFGISKNPESFATYGFRTYFTDKNRGAVIRLSADGITLISDKGMSDFFSDNLKTSSKLIGSFDEDKGLYNLTLNNLASDWQSTLSTDQSYNLEANCENSGTATNLVTETTVSFKESVDGWTSRKSFIPEAGISLNNTYYTFKNGVLWQHNISDTYNNFYDSQYFSSFNFFINEAPDTVKGYAALNYSGTASKELEYYYSGSWYSIAEIQAKGYTPTITRPKKIGWYVNYIRTNLESGIVKEFENKEGKYFNYIKAMHVCKNGEGIGAPDTIVADPQDYYLTTTIDTNCSQAGGSVLDGTIYYFTAFEGDQVGYKYFNQLLPLSTLRTTLQSAFNSDSSFVDGTIITSSVYSKSAGIQVGTILYNPYNNQPRSNTVAIARKENNIWSSTRSEITTTTANELDGRATIPDYWFVIQTDGTGTITNITQYNLIVLP